MSRWTTLLLLGVVLALGLMIWFETEREDPAPPIVELPLFEDLDVGGLTRIRIDNLDRSIHISMARDASGRWFLTDPIAYPARREMVVQLLEIVGRNQAWVVPGGELEAMERGLERPRAILELIDAGGRKRRLEMGPVDVDGLRINVRVVDGDLRALRRTWRTFETLLETSVQDWRSRRVFDVAYDQVVEIRRTGFDPLPDGPVELGLHAVRDGTGWWLDRPVRVQGDPSFLQMWSGVLAAARVDAFMSDKPEPVLAAWGLDPPAFTLTLVDRNGREETLEVGKPLAETSPYFCRKSGSQYVWQLDERDLSQLFLQPDQLFDPMLVRIPRELMEIVQLRSPEWDVRLTQDMSQGAWTVAWRAVGPDEQWTVEQPAAQDVVDGVIARLNDPEMIAAYLWHEPVDELFPADAPLSAVWVTSGGVRYGGRVGAEYTTEAGTPARLFLRERESAACLVPPELGELLARTPEDFLSLQLVELSEPTLQRIEISTGERAPRVFRRTIQTTWIHHDLETDAVPELLPVIEHLFYLTASRHVPRGEEEELLEVVTVRILGRTEWTTFEVGRTPSGEVRARTGSRQSVLKHQDLHADLLVIASRGG